MKRLLLASCIAVAALLAGGTAASAGGWAVTTLDALPEIPPDETVTIGFIIRQHGVTPVDVDGVAIVVMPEQGGTAQRFPARLEGPTGHYVVDLRVPAGNHRWVVEQGWFGPQELGSLTVGGDAASGAPAPAQPATDSSSRWVAADSIRWGLLIVTILAAAAFVGLVAWPSRASRTQPAR
jgi:hypothetical protein